MNTNAKAKKNTNTAAAVHHRLNVKNTLVQNTSTKMSRTKITCIYFYLKISTMLACFETSLHKNDIRLLNIVIQCSKAVQ